MAEVPKKLEFDKDFVSRRKLLAMTSAHLAQAPHAMKSSRLFALAREQSALRTASASCRVRPANVSMPKPSALYGNWQRFHFLASISGWNRLNGKTAVLTPVAGPSRLKRLLKVKACDHHLQTVIKAMSTKAMCRGIQAEHFAVFDPGGLFHKSHQGFCESFSAVALECNQVIDIKSFPAHEIFHDTKACGRDRFSAILDVDQSPADFVLHAPDSCKEILDIGDMRAQFAHNWKAAPDLVLGGGNANSRHFGANMAFALALAFAKSNWPA